MKYPKSALWLYRICHVLYILPGGSLLNRQASFAEMNVEQRHAVRETYCSHMIVAVCFSFGSSTTVGSAGGRCSPLATDMA